MRQKILFILPLLFALSATPGRPDNTFVIRVQSETETAEQVCDRLGLELIRLLDPISLETATSFEETEEALSREASVKSKKKTKKKSPHPSPEPPPPLPAAGGLYLVRASDALPKLSVLELLRAEKSIGPVESNYKLHLSETKPADDYSVPKNSRFAVDPDVVQRLTDRHPTDYFGDSVWTGYVEQPATRLINLEQTHDEFATGTGIIAVIDTGVDPKHPVLKKSLVKGYDFILDKAGKASEWAGIDDATAANLDQSTVSVLDAATIAVLNQSTVSVLDSSVANVLMAPEFAAFGHGTMVAGIIHLVAPHAKIMPLRVFAPDGTASSSDIIRAIYYAVKMGAKVINMSFSFSEFSPELMRAVNFATSHGVICVSSVGNLGKEMLVYPAAFANVMGIAATTDKDNRSKISNFGVDVVSLAAPGEGVITLFPGRNYAAAFGTSFSTAFVSGASALLLEIDKNAVQHHALVALSSAKKLSKDLGYGRLDLYKALAKHWKLLERK